VRFSTFALLIGVPLCLALPGSADVCDATPGNVVANCAFSDGTYTGTLPGIPFRNTDPGVPNFWSANPGFIEGYLITGLDTVMTNPVTGIDYLSMGTGEFGPEAALSQILTDVSGVTYDVSGATTSGGLQVVIDGNILLPDRAGLLSFVGTGTDELSLVVGPGLGPYEIRDVVVAPAGESEVPEPRTTFLIPLAMLGCFVWPSRCLRVTHR
jgi:hypothetical protein